MKISLKWLRDYVDPGLPPEEIAARLTMAGLEVKAVHKSGSDWQNVVVALVTEVKQHPNADRLKLATVDLGGRSVTVVCGAPNVQAGQKVPFASVGAWLKDGHTGQPTQLKPAKIRGVVSEGMICAEKELGISEDYSGIMVLPPDAPIGMPLSDYLGDVVLDVEVTPNRPDCMSVMGIAHEVAALTGRAMKSPDLDYEEGGKPVASLASVEIADPDLCPRYCASVISDVKVVPSPPWLQQRLTACGMRPINNIVDATNYVMLEYGQPLHAFDYERLTEHKIIVRRARDGEVITSLDGSERKLGEGMLIIADARRAVAVAGVMGGLDSEISEVTTTILLESASFSPVSIRRTSAGLKLRTEASIRFERGLSRELTMPALRRVTRLILQLAGGTAASGVIDVYPGKLGDKWIRLSATRVHGLLGMEPGIELVERMLGLLGFTCRKTGSPDELEVMVPYWRSDIQGVADLAEEVARIIGYDKIPVTQLSAALPVHEPAPRLAFRETLRDTMVGCGFQEVLTYSLTSEALTCKLTPTCQIYGPEPMKVANPLSQEQSSLRTTLRANLLACLAHNQKHEGGGIRLFEIGKVFLPQEKGQPREIEMLCAVLGGLKQPVSWRGQGKTIDFYDAKGVIEAVSERLGVAVEFAPVVDETFHTGRVAGIIADGAPIGVLGEVHPKVAEGFELGRTTYLIELDIEALLPLASADRRYQLLPRFPSVIRDIAVVLDRSVKWEQVERLVHGLPLVASCQLFDLYEGKPVPEGKKSLAFRMVYQSPDRTLTDEEADKVHQQIIDKLGQELGAVLRG
ncbi:MAG: phenylalanine--tRNA ligase subunit beta [Chloroflexota bacterium]